MLLGFTAGCDNGLTQSETTGSSTVTEFSDVARAQPAQVSGPTFIGIVNGIGCQEDYSTDFRDPDIAYTKWTVSNSNASVSYFWYSATVTAQSSGTVRLIFIGYNQNDQIIADGKKDITIDSASSC